MPLLRVYIHETAGAREWESEIHNSDQHGGLSGAATKGGEEKHEVREGKREREG